MARAGARQWGLPTTIARLNVPYGDNGGWPLFHLEMILAGQPISVHSNAPSIFNPIHEDDIVAMVPRLLEVAAVPATIVNWAGKDAVSIEEWSEYLGRLVGREPRFEHTDLALESVTTDNDRLRELVGETTVDWRDGMRRMVAAHHPEQTLAASE
jgi:nucleoside-diphosphate-sugar epimerase